MTIATRHAPHLKSALAFGAALLVWIWICVGDGKAETLSSTSYRLRAATSSAAGGIDHLSAAASPAIGALHGIGGQASTVGLSVGPVSGIVLEGGFHPAIRFVPEPRAGRLLGTGLLGLVGLNYHKRRL